MPARVDSAAAAARIVRGRIARSRGRDLGVPAPRRYAQQREVARVVAEHRHAYGRERLKDAEVLLDHQQIYYRSEQQFEIRRAQDHLTRDLRRTVVGAREHRAKLEHLEDRIRRLRDDVNGQPRNHADAEVDKMIRERRDDASPQPERAASQ